MSDHILLSLHFILFLYFYFATFSHNPENNYDLFTALIIIPKRKFTSSPAEVHESIARKYSPKTLSTAHPVQKEEYIDLSQSLAAGEAVERILQAPAWATSLPMALSAPGGIF